MRVALHSDFVMRLKFLLFVSSRQTDSERLWTSKTSGKIHPQLNCTRQARLHVFCSKHQYSESRCLLKCVEVGYTPTLCATTSGLRLLPRDQRRNADGIYIRPDIEGLAYSARLWRPGSYFVAQRKLAFWTYWAFAVKIFLSRSSEASKLDIGGMTKAGKCTTFRERKVKVQM
jgi:hypothetical protein